MKRVILFVVLAFCFANANFLNDYKIYRANSLYWQKNYKEALIEYSKIEPKDDTIYYNIANTLYRLKRYQKAIDYYKLIKSPKLTAKKYYNIGNAYAMQKNYLKAMIFYKNALKFSQNPKIKQNLEYAKKRLIIMRDIMLSNSKCSTTQAELLNFDDENISKDLQDAKYKNEQKFNISDSFEERLKGFASGDTNSSEKNSTKVIKQKELILKRTSNKLKERKAKVLLIPIKEGK